jgi:predicted nucleic acid-binding protein
MPEPGRVYFDTCVFIELLQQLDQKRIDACEDLRQKAIKGEIVIVTAAVTITEVNKLPDLPAIPEEQSRLILEFFENPYISVRPVTREIAEYAHEIVRVHKLTNLDAIHVATAIKSKAPVIYTYDGVKQRRKGLIRFNKKIGTPPILIEPPPDPLKDTLLGEKHLALVDSQVAKLRDIDIPAPTPT